MKQIQKSVKRALCNRLSKLLILTLSLYSLFLLNATILTAGVATLSWDPPTTNADGTPLTDLAGYKIRYGTASGNYPQVTDAGNVATYTFNSLVDGNTYYFAVTAYDTSGNESGYSNEVSKTLSPGVDTAPPVGTLTINNSATYTTSISATLNISATDTSGVSQMCISNTATCTTWETYATSKSWELTSGDGIKTVYVWFKDNLGNTNSTYYSASIALDTTAPTGSININSGAASTNNTNVTLTISASDANSVAQMQFSNDNATWSTTGAYATTKAWTLTTGDGTKTVYVKFKDNAGNWSTSYSDTIVLNTAAPVTTASPAPGLYNSAQSVTLTANKAATIYYTVDGTTPAITSSVYSSPVSITTTTAFKYFAKDSAGNTEAVKTSTYTIDTTAPTGSININAGAASANNTSATLTLSATDANAVSQMQFSNDNVTWSTAEAYVTTRAWALTSGDGTKTVYVKFRDNAGNWSAAFSDAIALDTAVPATTATPAPGLYSSTQSVTLAANKTATIYYTTNGTIPTTASPVYSTPVSITTTTTLKYFAKDSAGNTEAVKSSAYTIDTTAPTGTVSINAGAASTNNTSATLTLSATDTNTVSQMQFSNDIVTWSAAEAYATTKAWTLTTGDGTKTVYVKFKDNAGNWSTAYSDTISLSTGAPITTASPAGGTYKSAQTVALTANKAATIYFTTNGSVPSTSSPVYTAPVSLSTTTILKFFAVDTTGNSESVKTETYAIDTTSPAFSSTAPMQGSFINTAVVGYTLSETVTSGKITFVRTGGTLDSTTHVYNFTSSDTTIGTHNVNTGMSLTNGTIYTVSFDATDLAGNTAATVANTGITYDAAGASVSINSPVSNSIANNSTVTYNLSENISAGEIVFTRTGGSIDGLSPHNYVLGPGDKTSGSHTVNTGIILINGAIYSVKIRNIADMAGNLSASVTGTNITYDAAAITITNAMPAQSTILTTSAVQYTLSEAASSGKVTFTRSGGNPDTNSPHVYNLYSSDLYPGAHSINTSLQLADGTFYTVSFDAKDVAGNPATVVSNAMVYYDSTYANTPIGNVDNKGQSKKRVDGSDLVKIAVAFGSKPGDLNWNPVCDINSNNRIDGNDLITFASHFGEVAQ